MKKEVKISVRELVEFIMRHGSIDNRYVSSVKAIEGTRAHQKIQKSYKENYSAEVPLKFKFNYEGIDIFIEGRADGILIEEDTVVIDEIKTTVRDLKNIDEEFNPLHWAQAKCYGFIYCKENNLENIIIQLTYYNIEDMSIKYLRKDFEFKELEEFFFNLIDEYKYWAQLESKWMECRNDSIKSLQFPFEEYRKGQRDLAVRVYSSIVHKKKCFAQAPTGIGKTISTVFPALKAMGEGYTSKIFYLTAKTITREVAENTIKLIKKQNINLKFVTLTAKDKMCKMDEANCNPEYCPYAKDYYDKINEALKSILKEYHDFTRKTMEEISERYGLCPFELSLDLTLWCDVIICDYNYVFDPRVALKRFFEGKKTDFTFLIDESHNLIDRGREMYSAKLSKAMILELKKEMIKKDKKINNSLKHVNSFFIEKRKLLEFLKKDNIVEKAEPIDIYNLLRVFVERTEEYLAISKEENKKLLEVYFEVHKFLAIAEFYSEDYVTIYDNSDGDITIKLYCVNPSKLIQDKMKKGISSVIFSATLMPMEYFKDILGAEEGDHIVNLMSPFDVKNRLLLIGDNIVTTYNKREYTCEEIVKYINSCVKAKQGNYMVFFPSYKYMEMIFTKFKESYPKVDAVIQENNMSEEEKEEFLSGFSEENSSTHIGFCVLGGHFSEGIDLTYDKLIGVIVVGVGMPQIGLDRDIIRDYFNGEDNKGFDYAYVYPGMIKVLQAAGRCIRTEDDKGIIMLLDNRYSQKRYEGLFPYEWISNKKVRCYKDVEKYCSEFWN
ncbi:DNA excision repair protein ERCC-2 [Clostridium collagenovorans DSM 3089]|uniref:DNA excision repair protein ERCC-2 n=1 Tax=Clostridium collagenovorans DSM 3089 TaxID=1121306 RepID=A0A1M5U5W6_9CLOT|nr:ATP-dependent DNA helicase [Clostridium collagenovorans]SHH58339.1 DNA excision repair protein ERCC-2 [Clostridium collagenovorans DSM 3089]